MKKHIIAILGVAILALAFTGAASTSQAADLTYTALPSTADSELVLLHKSQVAASSNKYANITLAAPTTTVVKSGSGVLVSIIINTGASTGTATIYDNTAASGTKIATVACDTPIALPYNCRFATGLTVVTATAAANITVIYR